jgi:hypothetical protein
LASAASPLTGVFNHFVQCSNIFLYWSKAMTIPSSASASDQLTELHAGGSVSVEAALAFFDRLEPVDLDFMLGRWQGSEFPTNHPMDGLLELANWYGKEFVSPDCVHPLLMRNGSPAGLQNGPLIR